MQFCFETTKMLTFYNFCEAGNLGKQNLNEILQIASITLIKTI